LNCSGSIYASTYVHSIANIKILLLCRREVKNMNELLQQLVNGVSLGSIYALIALGYTMVYGIINLINFAHGEIYMIGAYVGFALTTFLHLGFWPSLIISMAACSILGVVVERVAYKPIRKSTRIAALITAISVSLFLQYGMMYFVKAETRTFPDVLAKTNINLFNGGVVLDSRNLYILMITIVLMILLQFVIHRTKVGKAMRAVSLDSEAAQLMGVDVNKTISYTFAIGSALAGAAGVLVGVYYNTINPLMGAGPGLKAFVAAVIGGIGIIPGAVFGGFFLGMTETMVSAYGGSLFKDAVAFAILILILLIKPSGLLGRNVKEKV
jgi:branched-chain amino acid transport system permease protein